jgi:mannose-6-phosphate isomerase-like protein (cupin superfamily)
VDSGGGFSLVEHPIPPRHLAAPLHRQSREDEYSYVIEGRLGALLGEDEVYAEVGELVFKPRHQWHTFWNAGDSPCRILEIISPGGFEHYWKNLPRTLRRASAPNVPRTESDLGGLARAVSGSASASRVSTDDVDRRRVAAAGQRVRQPLGVRSPSQEGVGSRPTPPQPHPLGGVAPSSAPGSPATGVRRVEVAVDPKTRRSWLQERMSRPVVATAVSLGGAGRFQIIVLSRATFQLIVISRMHELRDP